jgi:hypothetical protein
MSCSVKGWSKESGRFYEVDPDSFKYACEPLGKGNVEKSEAPTVKANAFNLKTIFRNACEAVIAQ